VAQAYRRAHAGDPVSAYGGVVAANRPISVAMAAPLSAVFTEVVVAPGYEAGVVELLADRRNLRLLEVPSWAPAVTEVRQISGGVLMQTRDGLDEPGDSPIGWRLVAGPPGDPATLADLEFAWRAVRSVRSNAVLLAEAGAAVGIGMGQVNRVDAARLALLRAGARAAGSVAASDAFFPFPDGVEVLVEAGVRAVVQPGGSVRDAEVIAVAEVAGVSMYLTGVRHFLH
jgi:phosphoribosylaminoimidazolecarboxamide formyltransferase/IMP cyclohydrolase